MYNNDCMRLCAKKKHKYACVFEQPYLNVSLPSSLYLQALVSAPFHSSFFVPVVRRVPFHCECRYK